MGAINFLIMCAGFTFIWAACDYKRKTDKIKFLSKDWWVQFALILIGALLVDLSH